MRSFCFLPSVCLYVYLRNLSATNATSVPSINRGVATATAMIRIDAVINCESMLFVPSSSGAVALQL